MIGILKVWVNRVEAATERARVDDLRKFNEHHAKEEKRRGSWMSRVTGESRDPCCVATPAVGGISA